MSLPLVLLHSPLTGAVVWHQVADELRGRGVPVVVPEVTADDRPPYAERYAETAAAQVPGDGPVLLVPHSGAGPLAPLVAARLGARAAAAVYVDAMLPAHRGESRLDLLAAEDSGLADRLREHLVAGGRFPEWTDADLRDEVPDDALRGALVASLRPRGLDFFTEPVPAGRAAPASGYLQLSPAYDAVVALVTSRLGWRVERLPGRHFTPMTDPVAVADALLGFGFHG